MYTSTYPAMDSASIPFSGSCSPIRIKRKRFPKQMCMAQLKMPTSPKYKMTQSMFDAFTNSSDEEDEDHTDEQDNLRLHRQKSWLSLRTSNSTLLSLRSMTDIQRKSFRALFDILDHDKTGIVCLNKLAELLRSLGADITLAKLMRVSKTPYITKYPHLTFIQFCALLLRDDIKVKLRNKSMSKINKMRYERQQYIKNMQYIRDNPTEGQRQVIELRKKLDELEAMSVKKRASKSSKNNSTATTRVTSACPSHRERTHTTCTNVLNGTRVFQIPISVFIQSWHRKQLINELEQHSFLSGSTVRRTRRYVSKSCKNASRRLSRSKLHSISNQSNTSHPRSLRTNNLDSVEEGLLSRRNLINTLDSAIDRKYKSSSSRSRKSRSREKRQIFDFEEGHLPTHRPLGDALTVPNQRALQRSCTESTLYPKQFESSSTRSFSKAVNRAMRQIEDSIDPEFGMYSLIKSKEAIKHEISSCHMTSPKTLKQCMSSPTFRGVRKSSTKTPAERFILKRNSTLPRLLLHT